MARLGDICTIVSGTTPSSTVPEYWDGNLNWVTPAEMTDESGLIYESQRKITELGAKQSGLSPFPAGTVLLSSRAPIGKVGIAGVEMYCNQGFKNLICSDAIHNKYLYWFLIYRKEYLNSLGRGATFKEISKSIVEAIDIPLPSVPEQKKIASLLDSISELISLRKKQLQKLDDLAKSRFVEMFGDPVANPKQWPTRSFIEMGSCKNGMNFHNDDTGIKIHCLGVGDFQDHSTITNALSLPVISLDEMPSKEYLLRDEDIVFVRSNGNKALVGRSIAVYPGSIPTTFSGFCIRFRKRTNSVTISYLLRVLKTDSIRAIMAGRGANIQNLNQQILGALVIPVPPIELQDQYSAFAERINKSKLTVQQGLDKLELLKQSLMQKYFG